MSIERKPPGVAGDLTPQEKRELLKRMLQQEGQGKAQHTGIPARGAAPAPLTYAQEGLWFLDRVNRGDDSYRVLVLVRMEGRLDADALQRTLTEIVRRHEVLRCIYPERDGRPFVEVTDASQVPMPITELPLQAEADRERELDRLIRALYARPFDLARGPLLRAELVRFAPQAHCLMIMIHHIAADGWSAGVVYHELCAIYGAYAQGQPSPLPELPLQYTDFAAWQRERLQGPALAKHLEFWKHKLHDAPPLELPRDRPGAALSSFAAISEEHRIPRALGQALREFARREGVTVFVAMLAVFQLLLRRYSGQHDVVIGTPVMTRNRPELEPMIGLLVNMVALRTNVADTLSFREFVRAVRGVVLDASDHAEAPFEAVVQAVQPERVSRRNPIFQVAFCLDMGCQPAVLAGRSVAGLAFSSIRKNDILTHMEVEVYLRDNGEDLGLLLVCAADLFRADTVRRLLNHFVCLLDSAMAAPDQPLSALSMLAAEERERLLGAWGGVVTAYPRDATITGLFEAQAARTPASLAVVYGDVRLSYAELNLRANRLAHQLRSHGVESDVPVAVMLRRSADLVIAWLAVLKAGGAYVPLDPDYPDARLTGMLDDSQSRVVVTEASCRARVPAGVLSLDVADQQLARCSSDNPPPSAAAGSLAYIVYTSGSTGQPKGVCVPHRAVVRLVRDTNYVSLGSQDRVLQASNASFDAATFEVWGALLNGAVLVGAARDVVLSPQAYRAFLAERQITTVFITTALFNQVAREAPDAFGGVDSVLFGGEMVDVGCVRAILYGPAPPRRLLHVYGPTETTTFATWHEVRAVGADDVTVPIGGPIANTEIYVLDEAMRPVPVGVRGELYIGGDGLARGYWRSPELTARKFVAHPFRETPDARLYRTGDLVRWRDDGGIEILGRADNQVKLRGFRIELGEIEARLRAQPGVGDAVALVRADAAGDRRLIAWVVPAGGPAPAPDALRAALQRELPGYMVPAAVLVIPELPLTPNGKVDHRALPVPQAGQHASVSHLALTSAFEAEIAAIWKEVLGSADVGPDQSFFEAGGHSLLLVRVQQLIASRTGHELPIAALFEFPTIRALARYLREGRAEPVAGEAPAARVTTATGAAQTVEPIAIIGMAGRFPGAANVEQFWRNLRDGVESIRFFTTEELLGAGCDAQLVADPNYVPARGYLDGADLFDSQFFGYSPKEAALIDPQQRLFLECAWEALEVAGYDAERYDGRIGVYGGSSMNSYQLQLYTQPESRRALAGLQGVISSDKDFLPTRVAYKLNLRGPAVNVQTACSTSLVAVHEACRALLADECEMAMAGGVSVTVPLVGGYLYESGSIGSPDGHCRVFDAAAEGTVGGNGVGVVVLKRLSRALADGDHVHAVIRATAINNDGAVKVGFTAPSVDGQAQVIGSALQRAGIEPGSIGYIEAHGTGTKLGDPIEIAALRRVFSAVAGTKRIAIGSLKSNVGHLDAAAGVTGLIKAVMVLERAEIPPSLHFERPNPELRLAETPFEVSTRLHAWPAGSEPRRASVSSFGMGGTNAHAVLEQAPPQPAGIPSRGPQLLVVSARSSVALERMSANIADVLRSDARPELGDIAWTLQVGRRRFRHARVLVSDRAEDAARALGQPGAIATDREATARHAAFMFSGQGSQHAGMARGLYEAGGVFREVVDECCEQLRGPLGCDLRELLYPTGQAQAGAAERLTETRYAQPALFVIEYALARLWMSWGIRPAAMIGHSIGEYVAACLADVMSLADALSLVAERGRLMNALPAGSMLSVPMAATRLEPLLGADLAIASINAPELTVVSGTREASAELLARLAADRIEAKPLRTSHAFHSPMMEPILGEFARRVAQVRLGPPRVPYVSNLTGGWITDAEATDPAYYARHLRHAVQFSAGLERLFEHPEWALLEVGPGQALFALASRHPGRPKSQSIVASMPRADALQCGQEQVFVLEALGRLWLAGLMPDWAALHAPHRRRRVALPTYPFERQRCWLEPSRDVTSVPVVPAKVADIGQWFYEPSWQRTPGLIAGGELRQKNWIVFVDKAGLGDAVVEALERRGAAVTTVAAGAGFAAVAANRFVIDPQRAEDYQRLFTETAGRAGVPRRVVHLWAAAPMDTTADAEALLQRSAATGCYSVLFAVQALAALDFEDPLKLTIVTSQVCDVVGSESLCPEKATILGPIRVVGREHPQITVCHLDVEPPGQGIRRDATLAECIIAEADAPKVDTTVAYRGGHRWLQGVAQLRLEAPVEPSPRVRQGGAYLISGGLGGVGLDIAEWLARTAAAKLVLVGRTALPPRDEWTACLERLSASDPVRAKIARLRAIESAGGEVLACAADVSDREQMRPVIAAARARFGHICGVFHAAGVPGGGVLQRQSPATFAPVLAPKVGGTRVLDELLAGEGLDFMVLCSSLITSVSLPGRGEYVSANAFVDAFAQARSRRGGPPVMAINWDTWVDAGMAVEHGGRAGHGKPGAEDGLRSAEGIEALRRILAAGRPQVIVSVRPLGVMQAQQQVQAAAAQTAAAAPQAVEVPWQARPALGTEYVAPRNDVEAALAAIWGELLGIGQIGVNDNFFELGGDSVVSIQFVARAKQKGFRLTSKHTFDHQTIAELARVCSANLPAERREEDAVGSVLLTPIQRWFFEQQMPGHFLNQAVILEVKSPLSAEILQGAVKALVAHHDALRLRFPGAGPELREMTILAADDSVPVRRIELSEATAAERSRHIESVAAEVQAGMDIVNGPIMQVVYFDAGRGNSGRLLIVIHHLVVDAVSWRILLEDLETACTALKLGRPVQLPPRTTSLREWSRRLNEFAQSPAAEADLEYWSALGRKPLHRLPRDSEGAENTVATLDTIVLELEPGDTDALLMRVPKARKTQINDVLLTALAQAFATWTGRREIYLHLEGHGREFLADDIDVSRTVGWFTTMYPLHLALPEAGNALEALQSVRDQLRAVPGHGRSLGVLRYLSARDAVREALRALPDPEIVFLYLGRFEQGLAGSSALFAPATEPLGRERSEQARRPHLIEITTMVTGNRLRVYWSYSKAVHRRPTMERLAGEFVAALRAIVVSCSAEPSAGLSAGDFPAARLNQSMLEQLAASLGKSGQRTGK
jgi:amino acid adenylation domain-containing protein/non-ribosomal peptide synthase protein (TIGR01720 family)